jgi:hypothetical protein
MELDEIERIVDELDKSISKENAKVSLQKYGGDLDEAFIVATERGYLRLGVEFLKAGFAPYVSAEKTLGKRPYAIDVDIDYLITEDSDVHFDYFERNEDVTVKTYQESWEDRVIPIAILSAIVSVLALAVVGLVAIIKTLF